jgi:hypothetical protein
LKYNPEENETFGRNFTMNQELRWVKFETVMTALFLIKARSVSIFNCLLKKYHISDTGIHRNLYTGFM